MRTILSIYKTDLIRIGKNWAAVVVIAGLAFLPSLYAWFNIKASWDPYGNTKGITVAVVNLDKGATMLNKQVSFGDEIVASLRKNKKIGWIFTTEEVALSKVKHGDVYASIAIPDDFSQHIATVLTSDPVKAEIDYYVNEKINAIAPKITSSGAAGIIEEVSANFVKTASETIFRMFNEIGVELTEQLPVIEKMKSLVFRLEAVFPELNQAVDTAARDVDKATAIVQEAEQNLPAAKEIIATGEQLSALAGDVLGRSREVLAAASPFIKQDIGWIHQTALSVEQVTALLQDAAAKPDEVKTAVKQAASRLQEAAPIAAGLHSWFAQLDQTAVASLFSSETAKLGQLRSRLDELQTTFGQIAAAVNRGETAAAALVDRAHTLAGEAADISGSLYDRYDSEIAPKVKQALDKAEQTATSAERLLHQALQRMPDVEQILKDADTALTFGAPRIATIRQELPEAQKAVTNVANRIRAFEQQGDIRDIIELLRSNFEKKSDFFAHPVVLKQNKLYPIPNYGSAMSPFFTTLSLWVGALLLVSLITVDLHEEGRAFKDYQIYFGRYLTFGSIALFQALFVTLGDLYLLHAYVVDKLWFVLFSLVLSIVFMLIVYTLVSVFGNVGKAMAIILLVLQLAGSGGTFPIQVTPVFFQRIHPYLPFTYAISMMREATGGILWDIVQRDLVKMIVYIGLTLLIGLVLKTPINRLSVRFVENAKRSRLIH